MSRRLFHGQLADDIAGDDRLRAERLRLLARSLIDIVREALVRDGVVRIHGFGTFRLSRVKARRGINPQTGEPIDIPARNRVLFRPSKALRDRVEPDHPAAVPLAEPHESREAWLGGVMADSPVAGGLPAADNQRTERNYFPDRVAAAAMAEPTVRVTGSAHTPVGEGGSREANLGGTMAAAPSAGRVVLRKGDDEVPAAPAATSASEDDETEERGSREARLGTGSGVHAPAAGALPPEDAGPEVQEPRPPGSLPATQQGPAITPPAEPPVDRGDGSREAQLGGQATRVAAAGGLPEEGAPDVDSSQDWVAHDETTAAAAATPEEDWDVPRLHPPGEEPEPEPEPEREERRPAGPLLLLGVLLLLLLLGLIGWWLWPAGDSPGSATPVAGGEIERSGGEDTGAAEPEPEPAAEETVTAVAEPETATAEPEPQTTIAEPEPETATAAAETDIATAEPSATVEPATAEPEATEQPGTSDQAGAETAAEADAAAATTATADQAEAVDGDAAVATAAEATEPATAEGAAVAADQPATEVASAEATTAEAAPATEGAATASGEAPWFSAQEYVVARGDTLWDLSDFHYVNPYYWPHIWNHNQSLADPDRIEIDQVLLLPTLEGEPRNLTAADRRSIAEGYLRLYRLWQRTDAGNPQYALVGVRYFDPEVMPPELRNDPAAGLPGDALAAAFAALLEAEFPIQRQ